MQRVDKIICALLALMLFFSGMAVERATNKREDTENMKPAAASLYDTSYLENWCRGDEIGTIRMLGAWFYEQDAASEWTVIEDESGEIWIVPKGTIDEDDFLLLWINNNDTPDNLEDDYIVKVWKEAR